MEPNHAKDRSDKEKSKDAVSKTNIMSSRRTNAKAEKESSIRAMLCKKGDEPSSVMSETRGAEPKRLKL